MAPTTAASVGYCFFQPLPALSNPPALLPRLTESAGRPPPAVPLHTHPFPRRRFASTPLGPSGGGRSGNGGRVVLPPRGRRRQGFRRGARSRRRPPAAGETQNTPPRTPNAGARPPTATAPLCRPAWPHTPTLPHGRVGGAEGPPGRPHPVRSPPPPRGRHARAVALPPAATSLGGGKGGVEMTAMAGARGGRSGTAVKSSSPRTTRTLPYPPPPSFPQLSLDRPEPQVLSPKS